MAEQEVEKKYKTPAYVRKCVYEYKQRHKEKLDEERRLKKDDPEYRAKKAAYMREYTKRKKLEKLTKEESTKPIE
jgi:hypothetical protein